MKKSTKTEQKIYKEYNFEYYPLSDFINVNNFTHGKNAFVLSVNCQTIIKGFGEDKFESKCQVICSKEDLENMLKFPENINFNTLNNLNYLNKTNLFLASDEYINFYTQYGERGSSLAEYYGATQPPTFKGDLLEALKNNEYSIFEYCQETDIPYYLKDKDNHKFFAPIRLDYIMAEINEKVFNLDALLMFLKDKDNIILCNDDRKAKFFKTPLKENQNIKDFILEIPYYNREDEDDAKYCIELYLMPNKEEAQQISEWKENKDKSEDIYSYQQYIIHHVLDGLAFRKNVTNRFKM